MLARLEPARSQPCSHVTGAVTILLARTPVFEESNRWQANQFCAPSLIFILHSSDQVSAQTHGSAEVYLAFTRFCLLQLFTQTLKFFTQNVSSYKFSIFSCSINTCCCFFKAVCVRCTVTRFRVQQGQPLCSVFSNVFTVVLYVLRLLLRLNKNLQPH